MTKEQRRFGECMICKENTSYMDYCAEGFICSEECYDGFIQTL